MSHNLTLAGYQGEGSLLSASLQALSSSLRDGGWDGNVQCIPDVTASGESASSLFGSIERGDRQIGYMASGYLGARVAEFEVLDLPFAVSDRHSALQALDGDAGRLLGAALEKRTGLRVLAFWDNGFRHISNAIRPLLQPQDCRGLVIRTLDSAAYRQTLAALGFTPMTTDVKDLVHVVASGQVQAQENPLANLLAFSLWRHHPHVSLTGHVFGVLLLVCPRAWHDALDPRQRVALERAVREATRLQRDLASRRDAQAMAELRLQGVQIVAEAQLGLEAWRAAAEPVSRQLRERLPAPLVQAYLRPTLH